jgi:hypothetical protein
MFGPFWFARHTVRAFTPRRSCRRSSGGGGCLLAFLALAAIGGITGTQSAQTPTAGPYGYTQGSGGTLIPAYTPSGGGGHYPGGPAWTPGPPLPAHIPPVPAAPAVTSAPLTLSWGFITLAAVIVILGGPAIIGSRMAPTPIKVRTAKTRLTNDFYPCCGVATGTMHATTCPTNWQPPENPAQHSDRR